MFWSAVTLTKRQNRQSLCSSISSHVANFLIELHMRTFAMNSKVGTILNGPRRPRLQDIVLFHIRLSSPVGYEN